MTASAGSAGGARWWRRAVIYQVYIRSFADGDGDGLGDIAGLRDRLVYLADLGIDAIWVNPWYPSPMADAGYDVADYRDIDPRFGTLADAEALIGEAHGLGLRVLLDIVPNHTSDHHRWFCSALAAGEGSVERDRYLFRPGRGEAGELPPNDWDSVFGGPAWTRIASPSGAPGQWYLHLFAPQQPDLNWQNAEVRADFEATLRFWFDRGVDGFRIDVANSLVKEPGLPDLAAALPDLAAALPDLAAALPDLAAALPDLAAALPDLAAALPDLAAGSAADLAPHPTHLAGPARSEHPFWDRGEVHDIYRAWRRIADSYPDQRVFVAEAWVDTPERLARYVRSDELHTAFNFDFLRSSWTAPALRATIESTLACHDAVGAPATWVLSNHDVARPVSRYARPQSGAPVRSLDELLAIDGASGVPADFARGTRRARAAALLMLALPGGAYIYQGEELGLPEVEDLPDAVLADPTWERSGHTQRGRDGCRVPIPWSGARPPFGFSPSGSAAPWLPQPPRWRDHTVETLEVDPDSIMALYRAALRIRRGHEALGDGTLRWLDGPANSLVFAREPGFVCAVNLSDQPIPRPRGEVLLASGPLLPGRSPAEGPTLPPDTAVWLSTVDLDPPGRP